MANNNLQPKEKKHKFSVMITTKDYQNLIKNTLKDTKRANKFIANVSTVVANNPMLQECDAKTILSSAFLAESLQLSMSPQLGYCYLVPYEVAKKDANGRTIWLLNEDGSHQTDGNGRWLKATEKKAQFQMGYKGLLALAMRSGQYRDIDVIEIKEGEFKGRNKETGKFEFEFIQDEDKRRQKETIGYLGYFELLTGFTKKLYISKKDMEIHADTYSKSFNLADYRKLQAGQIPERDMWKYSSFWYKNFDSMAFKTVLRQLISKWGVMSIEMQEAYTKDMAVIREDGTTDYVDNPLEDVFDSEIIEVEAEKVTTNKKATKLDEVVE